MQPLDHEGTVCTRSLNKAPLSQIKTPYPRSSWTTHSGPTLCLGAPCFPSLSFNKLSALLYPLCVCASNSSWAKDKNQCPAAGAGPDYPCISASLHQWETCSLHFFRGSHGNLKSLWESIDQNPIWDRCLKWEMRHNHWFTCKSRCNQNQ